MKHLTPYCFCCSISCFPDQERLPKLDLFPIPETARSYPQLYALHQQFQSCHLICSTAPSASSAQTGSQLSTTSKTDLAWYNALACLHMPAVCPTCNYGCKRRCRMIPYENSACECFKQPYTGTMWLIKRGKTTHPGCPLWFRCSSPWLS